jgi:glutamate-1-semialdehyde 2,1-aminomutase
MTDGLSATRRDTTRSDELFARARRVIPGGVNSPVRAFATVGGSPPFIERGSGPYIWDVDGNQYVDYVMSWGPLIHGHAFGPVVYALESAAAYGTSFGASTEAEVTLAEAVVAAVPSIEMVRFVNSGTEATMSALRLARAVTGRDVIVKFAGNYHGHADALLAEAGSGSLTLGVPTSPGVTAAAARDTKVVPYNDPGALRAVFDRDGARIAAVIVEPIAGNMGVILPEADFLSVIRELTRHHGALFICDEVITGFRVARGGAQAVLELKPDITTLGKIIGGGLPVGAYGGSRALMEQMAPSGDVYQAGTLSGNPLAMRAGLANLAPLTQPGFYTDLDRKSQRLAGGLRRTASEAGVPVTVNACTGMLTVFFTAGPVNTLTGARHSDTALFARFFQDMLAHGIYLPPSQFEAWMLSSAHTDEVIDETIAVAQDAFRSLGATPGT